MYEGEDIDGLIDEELEEYGAQLDDDNGMIVIMIVCGCGSLCQ